VKHKDQTLTDKSNDLEKKNYVMLNDFGQTGCL